MRVVKGVASITIGAVNEDMIFVMKFGEDICLLTREHWGYGWFTWRTLNNDFTMGNSYSGGETLEEAIDLDLKAREYYAFTDYKEALQFILDNS